MRGSLWYSTVILQTIGGFPMSVYSSEANEPSLCELKLELHGLLWIGVECKVLHILSAVEHCGSFPQVIL